VTRARSLLLAVVTLVCPVVASAQMYSTSARTGVYYETLSFGDGIAFSKISELTIPFVLTQRLGNRLTLDLSSAYANASVSEPGGGEVTYSGLVDTDVRGTIAVIPGRLLFNLVGTLPTGAKAVADTTIPLFGATATDLFGFTTPSFGSGGGVSAGFASAFQMGTNWAFGAGASFRQGMAYTPVAGGSEMAPGGEIRARMGIEGPMSGGKYFRGAFVYTKTANNDLGGGSQSAIGDRFLLYAALTMPTGNSRLSLYGWDMKRQRPSDFATPGTVSVPAGNVLALGVKLDKPLSPQTTLAPLLEFRHELTSTGTQMELLGYLMRLGTDLRYRLSDRATTVLQAQFATGTLHDQGTTVSVTGPRVGLWIEWMR
jgi:hypothetical protein